MQRNEQMYQHCLQHMGRHVKADMADQQTFYGFVENVDVENVYLIVLESDNGYDDYYGGHGHHHDQRVFGGFGYGYPGYGYGYGRPRFRWNRLALPLAALTAISLLY
ncbi:hypothetical protein EPH95_17790 [Salicibibacter halophilus]|uniref:Uncharacterized protein n=1 Tax=Salicibibacter halophilus TaxID=2502791 RepID=A0A514LNB1_9BACI|nr:hypothetical protein [Salicibibacter halophilus]QDI92791.1 hypothetical protein EPH95_17790 [Salicibibacter halophilus]